MQRYGGESARSFRWAAPRGVGVPLIALSLIAMPHAVRAEANAAGINCTEIPGHVSFGGLNVVPDPPIVGDSAQLSFNVGFQVYTVRHTALTGLAPFLVQQGQSGSTTFQVLAVMAGTASVMLEVTYGTEESCERSDGSTYFQVGPDRTVTSPAYSVTVLEAPTPTPTLTLTPAPSPTPTQSLTATPSPMAGSRGDDDDGCQIGVPRGSLGSLLLVTGVLLLAVERKRRS